MKQIPLFHPFTLFQIKGSNWGKYFYIEQQFKALFWQNPLPLSRKNGSAK